MKSEICGCKLTDDPNSLQYNCGGDCLMRMVDVGDPDCAFTAVRIQKAMITELLAKLETAKSAFISIKKSPGGGPGKRIATQALAQLNSPNIKHAWETMDGDSERTESEAMTPNQTDEEQEAMKDREETIAWDTMYCQHYEARGLPDICKAGVNYKDQFKGGKICCYKGGKRTEEEQLASCPKWLRQTREHGEARADAFDAVMKRMTVVGPVVAAWRKKPPKGKQEVIECPVCKGRLHLSQVAYNGHVHGHCETKGCVSWME